MYWESTENWSGLFASDLLFIIDWGKNNLATLESMRGGGGGEGLGARAHVFCWARFVCPLWKANPICSGMHQLSFEVLTDR